MLQGNPPSADGFLSAFAALEGAALQIAIVDDETAGAEVEQSKPNVEHGDNGPKEPKPPKTDVLCAVGPERFATKLVQHEQSVSRTGYSSIHIPGKLRPWVFFILIQAQEPGWCSIEDLEEAWTCSGRQKEPTSVAVQKQVSDLRRDLKPLGVEISQEELVAANSSKYRLEEVEEAP